MFKAISLILVISLFIFLQIRICKNLNNIKLGLILPIGCFLLALMALISIIIIYITSFLSDNKSFNFMYIVVYSIVIFIPSIIFMIIYLYYNKKSKSKD